MNQPCPCHSGLPYTSCCQPLHQGEPPKSARALMRSRYTAYALNIPKYIIHTTHPDNPTRQKNLKKWESEISAFSTHTRFFNLKILEFNEQENEAFVTFRASLSQDGQDTSFTEKSRFLKINGKWLYVSGTILE